MWRHGAETCLLLIAVFFGPGCSQTTTDRVYKDNCYLAGEHKYCVVHHVQLEKDTVPIIHGLIYMPQEYTQASKAFPNSNKQVFGGCLGGPEREETEVWYCHGCRQAEDKWVAAVHAADKAALLRRVQESSDVDAPDVYGGTLLQYAADRGYADIVKMLIDRGANVKAKDEHGGTVLHYAAQADHADVVKQLIGAGADVGARDSYGRTPLHEAAWFSSKSVVTILIENGADINAQDSNDTTPLYLAKAFNQKDRQVVAYLEELGAVCDVPFIRRIEESNDVNARNGEGKTLLHQAADEGYYNAVKKLVARGSNVNARDDFGDTPLYASVWGCSAGVMSLLIEAGADIDSRNESAETALHHAAEQGYAWAVETLIEAGADVNARDEAGDTPLFSAAGSDDVAVLKLLIDAGADVNTKNKFGETPLSEAGRWNADVRRLLVAAGAQ
jgi:ankyrin repeat protein